MPTRKPGPYLLVIPYFVSTIRHEFTINCDTVGTPVIGSDPAILEMRNRGGSSTALASAANALWGAMRALLSTSVVALSYELFKVNQTNGKRSFVSGGTLSAPNGSSAGVTIPAKQATLTFRTGSANIMKLELIGVPITRDDISPLASGATGETAAIKNYILGPSNIAWGRDRAFPVAGLNEAFTQNEKAYNRIYRN